MSSAAMPLPIEARLARIVKPLAFAFALVVGIGLPGGYFEMRYSNLIEHAETMARVKAIAVNTVVNATPDLWTYQLQRMEILLMRYSKSPADDYAIVRDVAGAPVLIAGASPEAPVLVRSFPLYDSGRVVGQVEVRHSYRGIVIGTLAAGLLGLLLGALLYATLLALPLRALGRVGAALNRERGALIEREARYRQLFDANPDPMWFFDTDTLAFLAVNDAAVASYGWSRAEFLAMKLTDIRPESDIPHLRTRLVADESFRVVRNSRHRRKDGTLLDVDVSSHIIDFGGRRARVVVARDVTERKHAEEVLRESEERFRKLVQDVPSIAVQGYRADGTTKYWNQASERLYGYAAQEAIGRSLLDLIIPPEMREDVEHAIQEMATTGQPIPASELSLMRKDGSRVPVFSSHSIVQVPGREQELFCIDIDLTSQKKAAEALHSAEGKFRGLVEQSIVGIYMLQDGKLIYANPRFVEIVGQGSADELIGVDAMAWVAEADRPSVAESRQRLMSGETDNLTMEYDILRRDGVTIRASANSARATHEGRPAIIGVLQDISEKRRAEVEIQRYVAQLKTAFMSTVEVATILSEMRDPYTTGHERRVAEVAVAIGAELGLDATRQEGLRVAGYLHDVGKITIPAEILSKPGKLSALEYQLVQAHPQAGYDVLKGVAFPWPVAQVALQHHERIDGSGYPQGLKGDAILLEARILAVADVVEAMSSHRPYRPGLGIDKALSEIERGRGTAYDADAADACLRLFREKGYAIPD